MNNLAIITKAPPSFEGASFTRGVENKVRRAKTSSVVNSLNRINFHNKQVFVRLRNIWSNSFETIAAQPRPTNESGIQLTWDASNRFLLKDISIYEYFGFFYIDGMKMVWVRADLIAMDCYGITLGKPDGGDEVNERNRRRFKSLSLPTTLTQGMINLQGTMKDCSSTAIAIKIKGDQSASVRKLNIDKSVKISLANGKEVMLEATCRTVRASAYGPETTIVLQPDSPNEKNIKAEHSYSVGQKLTPQPCIEFTHPFLAKKLSFKVVAISGARISVEEDSASSLLMPGMVIPEMAITFANDFKIYCRSQVISTRSGGDVDSTYSDLSIMEMNCKNQVQLASILFQAKNERSYVGTGVDQDELWDFFFETGFVYPKKYGAIEEQKGELKSLYERLYNGGCPDIARHITYRDKGIIYGHVSMFRYYRRTWILHHHAAIRSSRHKAGLVVMDHILQHINEVHNFSDAAMKYIACYFRPNNRFANRVFGGASRFLQDPRKSSLDEFAYSHIDGGEVRELHRGWNLIKSSREDFQELKSYYNDISGGLMLDGLDLGMGNGQDEEEINSRYKEKGLKRERKFYTLKNDDGQVAALFILNFSDVGLNMSSLTNCIQVFVVDKEKVESDKIENALSLLGEHFEGKTSVLLFPRRYADDNALAYENVYTLGILDLNYISKFISFMEGLTKSPSRLVPK